MRRHDGVGEGRAYQPMGGVDQQTWTIFYLLDTVVILPWSKPLQKEDHGRKSMTRRRSMIIDQLWAHAAGDQRRRSPEEGRKRK